MRKNDPVGEFTEAAESYCAWAQGPADPSSDLAEALGLLSLLYHLALSLPDVEPSALLSDADDRHNNTSEAIYKRFQQLPIAWYSEVFDPHAIPTDEPLTGDLGDDLRDIYIDLKDGLDLQRAGRVNDALFQWRFTFGIHWGRHATSALRAIHCYVTA